MFVSSYMYLRTLAGFTLKVDINDQQNMFCQLAFTYCGPTEAAKSNGLT